MGPTVLNTYLGLSAGPPAHEFFVATLGAPTLSSLPTRLAPAEWLTDVVVSADRNGEGGTLAARYAGSELATGNAHELAVVEKTAAEAAKGTKRRRSSLTKLMAGGATSTSWWWGWKTMVKV